MVRKPKPAHRSTNKKNSGRLNFIFKSMRDRTLLVWSIFALVSITIGYQALSVLMSPGEIEPENTAEDREAIAQVEVSDEPPTFPSEQVGDGVEREIAIPWLWMGAIALGVGSTMVLWRWLQSPNSHKRAALKRRRRQGSILSSRPAPFRVPKRDLPMGSQQKVAPSQPVAEVTEIPEITPQPLPSPEPPLPARTEAIANAYHSDPRPFNFEVSRTEQPPSPSTLQVPNFPKLAPQTALPPPMKPVRKDRKEDDLDDRDLRISS
ncbi:hypothetical protein [Roseofilum casamattae]|uniref:Uncharacterized protein n=1 Tax=Roseofilum casamattae BLCC-M143 TaxID=3022442 RepID=A0ABT7BTL9_9CYAN|nr:hypothetical protein [Roseofilum casamattae]MDJ1182531.1 hypothetical protein [Roseofilum casamattae BLCC-M143]